MTAYADLADIDAEILRYDVRNVEQQPHAVDSPQLNRRKIRNRLVLRPFYLVFYDVLAELRRKSVQLVARRFVNDYLARRIVPESDYIIPRQRIAATCDDKLVVIRARFRVVFCRIGVVRRIIVVVGVAPQFPEFENLAFGVRFEDFFEVVQIDYARTDFAVKFILVGAFVCRQHFAQYPAALRYAELIELLLENRDSALDVVLPFAFQEIRNRLLRFGRRNDVEPLRFRLGVVGCYDFYLVAGLNLFGYRLDFVIDFRPNRLVADFGVDVVCEIERSRSERQSPLFSFRCKYCYFGCIQR